jgi:hypothetical protein
MAVHDVACGDSSLVQAHRKTVPPNIASDVSGFDPRCHRLDGLARTSACRLIEAQTLVPKPYLPSSAQLGTHDRYKRDHLPRVTSEIVHDTELSVVGDTTIVRGLAAKL